MNTTPPAPGTRARVTEQKGERKSVVEGILLPSHSDDSIVLKLDSGYNIGVLLKNVTDIQVLEAPKKKGPQTQGAKKNKEHADARESKPLPKISILHTGGTIASKVDYETGGVIARYSPEDLLAMFPELKEIAHIQSRLIRNMWSEDMRFGHYNLMAS